MFDIDADLAISREEFLFIGKYVCHEQIFNSFIEYFDENVDLVDIY